MLRISTVLASFFCSIVLFAQSESSHSGKIYHRIQKLNFLGTVLYVAAHPDDENTRLITYSANHLKARTGYLSLTRGDGGQNLIGPQLGPALGLIRTQELLRARKIDGGEQFFTRANDFGFSKNPDETFEIWGEEAILADVVQVIRQFRPDVIVNRFDARTPGKTHGHHTASALLSLKAFDLAGQKKAFPDLLADLEPFQPSRLYMNTSWFFYGSKEKFEKADKSRFNAVSTGIYYPLLGFSNQEIAAKSRSAHQSQGFGAAAERGNDTEYLELLKGTQPKNKSDWFEGIDTSWNRVKGGKAIQAQIDAILGAYDFTDPSKSVPALAALYTDISKIDDAYWREYKLSELREIIAECAGLFLELGSNVQNASPGEEVSLLAEMVNRSRIPVTIRRVALAGTPLQKDAVALSFNEKALLKIPYTLSETEPYTQPYWLEQPPTNGRYQVQDRKLIGKPDVQRRLIADFDVEIAGISFRLSRPLCHKYTDPVRGEVYEAFDVVPALSLEFPQQVMLFTSDQPRKVSVVVKSQKAKTGELKLEVPAQWRVAPQALPFALEPGQSKRFDFELFPPQKAAQGVLKAVAASQGRTHAKKRTEIAFEHIGKQQLLEPAEAKIVKAEVKTGNEKIAYVMGAGDDIPAALRELGYDLTLLKPSEITPELLQGFDVLITGIRAYNTQPELLAKNKMLLDFAASGKTVIVQYNTTADLPKTAFTPYPIQISRDRVTREDSKVRLLKPEHPLLSFPNKISEDDFKGWPQEFGLYFPDQWGAEYTALLSMYDPGESAKQGSILTASYGKGTYIYTGLSFFRALPAGNTGAYRLFANMISARQTP